LIGGEERGIEDDRIDGVMLELELDTDGEGLYPVDDVTMAQGDISSVMLF